MLDKMPENFDNNRGDKRIIIGKKSRKNINKNFSYGGNNQQLDSIFTVSQIRYVHSFKHFLFLFRPSLTTWNFKIHQNCFNVTSNLCVECIWVTRYYLSHNRIDKGNGKNSILLLIFFYTRTIIFVDFFSLFFLPKTYSFVTCYCSNVSPLFSIFPSFPLFSHDSTI